MDKKAFNCTVVIVSTTKVKGVWADMAFNDRDAAMRYADGMAAGLAMAGKKYGIMVMPGGEYDPRTSFSRGMDCRHIGAFLNLYWWPIEEARIMAGHNGAAAPAMAI